MVRNLMEHILRGTSAVVSGGPKMGKTTLLQQTSAALIEKVKTVSVDVSAFPSADPPRVIPDGPDPVILLLDGCEALLPDPMLFLQNVIRTSTSSGENGRVVVWAGDMSWGEWAMAHRSDFGLSIRYYPLVLLPPKEARAVLKYSLSKEVTPDEIERSVEKAGGHPYILSHVLEEDEGRFDGLFSSLWETAASSTERCVLAHLIEVGSWVHLEDLEDDTGGRPPKKCLDRLATLGLIHRTIVEGAAAAKIVSPLLVDWARRVGLSLS
jgi:hypothetical protein